MPYAVDDVRSQLVVENVPTPEVFSSADYVEFHKFPPQEQKDNYRTWIARAQNYTISYTELDSGSLAFGRIGQPDEHVVLLHDDELSAVVMAGGETKTAAGKTLIIVPPGDSSIEVSGTGRVSWLVRTSVDDIAKLAVNAESYAKPHHNIPEFTPWPDPPAGFKVRIYDLNVAPMEKPPFRLFRCTTFMVNYIEYRIGPRRPDALSPHKHDDFEQVSLVIDGSFLHHLRWPWTTNRQNWIDDDHVLVESPSIAVIPPPSLHTSESQDPGKNHLIDLFSPPRLDFSKMEGWVYNADEYPMPEGGVIA